MAKKQETLGAAELDVLKVIWEKQPCSVPDVAAVMARSRGVARTTVLTVVQRLHKKGFLKRHKAEGIWLYESTRPKKNVMAGLARQFINTIFEGSSASLVMHLAEGPISDDERRQIRELLDQLDQKKEA